MKATEILRQEHTLIQEVLNSLERGAQKLAAGTDVPADFFVDAADFIRGFADDTHHKKEEGVLFKTMARHGFPEEGGPLAVMLAEHDEARRFTRGLSEAAAKMSRGEKGAGDDVVMYGLSYVRLLRQHIMKESNILFEMADSVIPKAEHAQIEADFEKVEREQVGPGVHEKYAAIADKLRKQMA